MYISKKLQTIIATIFAAALLTFTVSPLTVLAAGSGSGSGGGTGAGSCTSASSCACTGAHAINTSGAQDCSASKSGSELGGLVSTVIGIISILIGVIAIIMILVAAIKFVTSGGDQNAVSSAKNTLIYAIVGLVVAALAQILVHFVLHNVASK